MYYKISNGSVTLSGNTILEDINFKVSDNEKIGIVGRNGSGKTTLLKAIVGEIDLENGYDDLKVESVGDYKVGYVKQNVDNNLNIKMIDYIVDAYSNLIDIEKSMKKLENKMISGYDENIVNKYNDLISKYEYLGGYTYKKEYEVALKKFGFSESDKDKLLSEFSGGQLTKLSLVKLLLSKPDLLILDEPTNHLDINTIEWLEDYLKNYNKSIIIVSHDRMFLDNVCNVIYDIEYGTLKRYNGNYTYFVNKKHEDYLKQERDYETQQKEIKRLQAIADRFRYKPSKASMAMSKLKQIERMVKIDKPQKENNRTFKTNFSPNQESYRDVLKVKNLSIGYDKELSRVTFNVERKDKLGIIGENGIGKSTLLKTIMGFISPLGGKYTFGDKVNIGYFSQQLDNIDPSKTIYEEIDNAFPSMSPTEIRSLLGAFDFHGDEVFKNISSLSGGEKVRVSLCKILNSRPNVLILDEPTNHLDIINKNTIEKMLKEYNGTIIMVSHDRYLIKNVCTKLLVFNKDEVVLYNYGYDEYLEKRKVVKESEIIKKENKVSKKEVNINLIKEINKIEKVIDNKEKELAKLNKELLKEEVYMDISKAKAIQEKIKIITKEIEIKTKEWETLADKM
jgi:ATP-binding cassette subfamily F protein 3